MAQTPKDRLLFLINELALPMTQEEAGLNIDKLTLDQLELLVAMYEELKNYRNAIDRAAHDANPQEYERLEVEYRTDLEKIENEYTEKLAQIEDETDSETDKIISGHKSEVDKLLSNLKTAIPNS
jgi:hypothetical protein